MAAEAARSGPSADTYIGSLISLTSKSEIRYEGVLYNINTDESSIGLRNVRSFGTEGRKKDGPQIPASDKIYEYILFRGTDIKDLQVKSSSPAAQSAPIQNDPAIIQTHYVRPAPTSSSLPSVVSGNVGDVTSHTAHLGLPRSSFQGNLPLYQPGGGLGSWGSSATPPAASGSGLAMPPMYWQGYYAPSSGLPPLQQQALLRPPPGMPIPHSMQQPLQYSGLNTSVPSGPQNLSEFPPPLLQSTSSVSGLTSSSLPSLLSVSSASTLADETSSLLPIKTPVTDLPPSTLVVSLPLASSTASTIEPISTVPQSMPVVGSKANTITVPTVAYQAVSRSAQSVASSSTSTQVETSVQLITPSQLLQSGSSNQSAPQLLQTSQKDADAKAVETKTLSPESLVCSAAETKDPILPLPRPDIQKPSGAPSRTHFYNKGRGRGRGNGFPSPVVEFTEEFDFMAMNEKFNKDEVWGHLGKNKAHLKESDWELKEDEVDYTLEEEKEDIKPVYVKDDFFDSLSCTTLDGGNRRGRTRFSEQLKIDAETFGDSARHRPSRGGSRGFRGSARGRGSHYGRGYGYVSRGRGRSFPNHA